MCGKMALREEELCAQVRRACERRRVKIPDAE